MPNDKKLPPRLRVVTGDPSDPRRGERDATKSAQDQGGRASTPPPKREGKR